MEVEGTREGKEIKKKGQEEGSPKDSEWAGLNIKGRKWVVNGQREGKGWKGGKGGMGGKGE